MRTRREAAPRSGGPSRRPSRAARGRASPRGATRARRRRDSRASLRGSGRASGAPRRPRRDHSSPSPASSSMSCVMRTPLSTDGSYSKANWGVRFILSSRATRAWRTPWAAPSPSSVRSRFRSEPRTLTKTRAWRRSDDVSTAVIVTKPIRGSLSSPIPSESTSLTASFTRRMRSLIERHELPRSRPELPLLAVQVPLRLVQEPLRLPRLPRHARDGQPRALPKLVVVDLGHRGAEPVLELRFRRADELPLPLQRAGFREVQVDAEDGDVAHAHTPILPRGRGGLAAYAGAEEGSSDRSVRSIWRGSKTSETSP